MGLGRAFCAARTAGTGVPRNDWNVPLCLPRDGSDDN